MCVFNILRFVSMVSCSS